LDDAVVDALTELKFNSDLLRSLWDGSELPFPETELVQLR
jgi:hypothetical protein